jgi:hypothetical protein
MLNEIGSYVSALTPRIVSEFRNTRGGMLSGPGREERRAEKEQIPIEEQGGFLFANLVAPLFAGCSHSCHADPTQRKTRLVKLLRVLELLGPALDGQASAILPCLVGGVCPSAGQFLCSLLFFLCALLCAFIKLCLLP